MQHSERIQLACSMSMWRYLSSGSAVGALGCRRRQRHSVRERNRLACVLPLLCCAWLAYQQQLPARADETQAVHVAMHVSLRRARRMGQPTCCVAAAFHTALKFASAWQGGAAGFRGRRGHRRPPRWAAGGQPGDGGTGALPLPRAAPAAGRRRRRHRAALCRLRESPHVLTKSTNRERDFSLKGGAVETAAAAGRRRRRHRAALRRLGVCNFVFVYSQKERLKKKLNDWHFLEPLLPPGAVDDVTALHCAAFVSRFVVQLNRQTHRREYEWMSGNSRLEYLARYPSRQSS